MSNLLCVCSKENYCFLVRTARRRTVIVYSARTLGNNKKNNLIRITFSKNKPDFQKEKIIMQYLIDMGSSTIKVYERKNNRVSLVETKTFDFKDGFEPSYGLSSDNKEKIYAFFKELHARFSFSRFNTKIYATGIFRDIIKKQVFVEEFYAQTRLLFNIVAHDLEAFYLEKAWIGKYTSKGYLLVINIGGKTTELIIYNHGYVVERKLLSIGVGTVLKKYPYINENYSPVSLSEIVNYLRGELPPSENNIETAIYTGGELTYMEVAGYALQENTVFSDKNHPFMIRSNDYYSQNECVYEEITITNLKNMMPNNPDWMNGARACSALAQAICVQYGVEIIIPSDSNLIDGVNAQEVRSVVISGDYNKHSEPIKQLISKLENQGIDVLNRHCLPLFYGTINYELLAKQIYKKVWSDLELFDPIKSPNQIPLLMKGVSIVICGSFNKHLKHITKLIEEMKKLGMKIISPKDTEVIGSEKGFVLFKNDSVINHCTWSVEALHLRAIEECTYVIVCNFDDYVGSKTSLEIGYAKKLGKPVISLKDAVFQQVIEECDCVVVCNYESAVNVRTAFEIGYAYMCGKKVVFIEDNPIVEDFDIPSEVGLLLFEDLS